MTHKERSRQARRLELADFLQQRRSALQPEDVGLKSYGRRRVRGLRREEVAELAGVSPSWYTWFEQGREINVSDQALDAIARALRLDEDGTHYLRRLAGFGEPTLPAEGTAVHRQLLELLDDVMPDPAYVINDCSDMLAWNKSAVLLFGDLGRYPPKQRNLLWLYFMASDIRNRIEGWESEAQNVVARFRSLAGPYADESRFQEIVAELSENSPEFSRIWRQHDVQGYGGLVRVINHPVVGEVRTEILHLRPVGLGAVTVAIHRPADAISRARIDELIRSSSVES